METTRNRNRSSSIVISTDDDADEDGANDDHNDSGGEDERDSVDIGCLEFSTGADKVEDVRKLKDKVKGLFGVTLEEDIKAAEMGKKEGERQWFKVVGSLENCREAKAFILASCDPGEAAIFDFDPQLYTILSSESQKRHIEKESNTVLMFESHSDGSVVIQGPDEMSVLTAMSLLEQVIYEASWSRKSLDKEPPTAALGRNEDDGTSMEITNSQGQSKPDIKSQYISSEEEMDTDVTGTGAAANDVMKSLNPEIQRLIKCGREKNYTDDEIREVLEKCSNVPKASEFFRSLHTCKNLRQNAAAVGQSGVKDPSTVLPNRTTSINDFMLRMSGTTKENEKDRSSPRDEHLFDWDSEARHSAKVAATAQQESPDILIECNTMDGLSLRRKSDSSEPIDLMNISDGEERKRQTEANQERNQRLFAAEQSRQQTGSKSATSAKSSPSLVEVVVSDSSANTSPSSKKRRKKKKKKKPTVISLVVGEEDDDEYRCRSPLKDSHVGVDVWSVVKPIDHAKPATPATSASSSSAILQRRPAPVVAPEKSNSFNIPGHSDVSPAFRVIPGLPQIPPVAQPLFPFPSSALVPSTTSQIQRRGIAPSELCYVVIDGSNVAMSHGNGKFFSCQGIRIAVRHFQQRGHQEITVFVPQWRRQAFSTYDNPIRDKQILEELSDEGIMKFTPSRRVPGKPNISCYDDRFILRLADDTGGIVVSNDNYRDLYQEKPEWHRLIETRILSYTFVGDRFMLPDDPLGRDGPSLDEFLSASRLTTATASVPLRGSLAGQPSAMHGRQQPGAYLPDVIQPMPGSFPQHRQQHFGPTASEGRVPNFPQNRNPVPFTQVPNDNDFGEWTNKINQSIPVNHPPTHRWPFGTAPVVPPVQNQAQQQSMRNRGPGPVTRQQVAARYQAAPRFVVQRPPGAPQRFQAPNVPHKQTHGHQQMPNAKPVRPRSLSETQEFRNRLLEIFPDGEKHIDELLAQNQCETRLELLTDLMLTKMEDV